MGKQPGPATIERRLRSAIAELKRRRELIAKERDGWKDSAEAWQEDATRIEKELEWLRGVHADACAALRKGAKS